MLRTLPVFLTLMGAAAAIAAERPNVIFFATDDLCDWVGPLGHTQARTPNMDQLPKAGVTFTNAHCPGTFCAPSRSAPREFAPAGTAKKKLRLVPAQEAFRWELK